MLNGCVASRLKMLTYNRICLALGVSRALPSNMIYNSEEPLMVGDASSILREGKPVVIKTPRLLNQLHYFLCFPKEKPSFFIL